MLSFYEWRYWLRSLPWSLRWFPLLVLLRPVIDQFWTLKHISPFISPLYWAGILTPVLCVYGIRQYRSPSTTRVSSVFGSWSFLAIVNAGIVLLMHLDINYLILLLKVTLPIYLFYFLRVFIQSKQDLQGILVSFFYSWVIVMFLFGYELLFGARSIEITRQTLERFEGGFADVLNYALYAVSGFIVLTYFYFNSESRKGTFKRLLPAIIGLLLGLLLLGKIYHTTSFIAMALIIPVALFRIFADKPGVGFSFIIVVVIVLFTIGSDIKSEAFDPLIAGELEALEEGEITYRQFNGRMGRWMYYWGYFQNGNLVGKLLGSGVGLFGNLGSMGVAVHNDFLRITFFTGFFGVLLYLFFLIVLFFKRRILAKGERFLLEASLLMLFIYSMTTLPTMYAPFMYFLMAVFAYASLPEEMILENNLADDEDEDLAE